MSRIRVNELQSLETGKVVEVGHIDTSLRADLSDPDKGGALVHVTTSTGEQKLADALDGRATNFELSQLRSDALLETSLNVSIPTDYSTLQEAIDELGILSTKQGVLITVNIESGHSLTAGLSVVGKDLSHFEITSDDATVHLDAGFVGVSGTLSADRDQDSLFVGVRCGFPTISTLVDMGNNHAHGLVLSGGAKGKVSPGKGVINAGDFGFLLTGGSSLDAPACVFRGANAGCRVTTNSSLNAPDCDLSGAKNEVFNGGQVACLDVSRGSIVNIMGENTNLTNSAGRGIAARRSWVSANGADVSGAFSDGVRAEAGSKVSFGSGVANDCGANNLVAFSGSEIEAGNATATGAGSYGARAEDGSSINARSANLSGAGTNGALANRGARINVASANCRKGSSDDSQDIRVLAGSIISAPDATGGTNISVNTITGNGIVFS